MRLWVGKVGGSWGSGLISAGYIDGGLCGGAIGIDGGIAVHRERVEPLPRGSGTVRLTGKWRTRSARPQGRIALSFQHYHGHIVLTNESEDSGWQRIVAANIIEQGSASPCSAGFSNFSFGGDHNDRRLESNP